MSASSKALVTGAAGFIGSNLCDYLLEKNLQVIGIDNFSTGQKEFLQKSERSSCFRLHESDLSNLDQIKGIFLDEKPDIVFHLAANADVRFGLEYPRRDLEQGTIVTHNVLEAARTAGVKKFAYSSTGSVYGEPNVFPTPEDCPFPIQTSLYAASKLAGEAMIQAYAEGFGMQGFIFRFVSILGPRYTHGHVFDFIQKLKLDPSQLEVLGDGKQKKAYLHIEDCLNAIWTVINKADQKINIYNLGPDEFSTVNDSLDTIESILGVSPIRKYSGGERGWVGDSPFIFLDCSKLKSLGWESTYSIQDGVKATAKFLLDNPQLIITGQNKDLAK